MHRVDDQAASRCEEPMTITCADCGSPQELPLLPPHGIAECHRCDRVLDRRRSTRFDLAFAAALGTLILLPPAMMLPLMRSTIQGIFYQQSRLASSIPEIYSQVWFPFAFGFFFFAFLIPAARAFFLLLVLGWLRWKWPIPQPGKTFRWAEELRIWSMTDVVAIAGVIAYYRAGVPADVDLMIGAWCYLVVAVLAIVTDRAVDRRAIWSAIIPDSEAPPSQAVTACAICELTLVEQGWEGRLCPRCGAVLNPHLAMRFAPAAGIIGAAALLYFPALSFAVIVNEQLTGIVEHTVIGTVQLLADYGYWQIGVILLLAGFVIPMGAIVAMGWMLARVAIPSRDGLVRRTRVDRVVRRLVRWPMVIPFIAAIAAPIVDYPNVDDILAGPGATPYFAVVVLLMLAVRIFRPRMMWRAAGEA